MRLTRKITAEFVGVFLIGIGVGGLLMWDLADTKLVEFMKKTNDPDSVIVARIKKKYVAEYQLTPEEIDRIEPLIKDMALHVSQVRHEFGVNMIATLQTYHEKIAEKLTPEHRATYVKATEERKKQLESLLLVDQNPPNPGQK